VEVWFHPFPNLALYGAEWSATCPGHSTPKCLKMCIPLEYTFSFLLRLKSLTSQLQFRKMNFVLKELTERLSNKEVYHIPNLTACKTVL